jgi:hypothetical protein
MTGLGTAAKFGNLQRISVDAAGNVYVADSSNHTIRKITAAGVVTSIAGSAGVSGSANGANSQARLKFPMQAVMGANGLLYISDSGNNQIRVMAADGSISTLAGSGVAGGNDGLGSAATFNSPVGIAIDGDGSLIVSDASGHTIPEE